jgi:predicted DNA-binding protein
MLAGKRHKKTATFQVYEDQLEILQKISGETGLSQAEVLRQFIDRGVEEYEIDRAKRRGRGSRH